MEAPIFLAADFANVDGTGKLNIIGAFNRLNVAQFPYVHPAMYLAIRLVIELGEFNKEKTLKVTLFSEDAEEVWTTGDIKFTVPLPLEGKATEFHPIIGIQQLKFDHPGRFEFRLFINDDSKGETPLDVVKADQPSQGQ